MKRFMSLRLFVLTLVAAVGTSFAHPADPTGDIIKYLLYGQDGVNFKNKAVVEDTEGWLGAGGGDGFVVGGGSDQVKYGGPVVTHGFSLGHTDNTVASKNWWVEGNLAVTGAWRGNLTVAGDVLASGSISVATGTTLNATGAMRDHDATVAGLVPDIDISGFSYDVPAGTGSQSVSGGTLPPGTYGDVEISGAVTFTQGDYYFASITYANTESGIRVSKPNGTTTRIMVRNGISLGSWNAYGLKLDVSNGDEYGRVLLYVQNQTSWTTPSGSGNFRLDATILMPKATITIGTNANLHGQILAKKIVTGDDLTLAGDAFHPWNPVGISLVGASTITLPEHHAACATPSPSSACSHLEQLSVQTGKASSVPINVRYLVRPLPSGNADSAATLNSDFSLSLNGAAASGSVNIPAGQLIAAEKIKIWVIDDGEYERHNTDLPDQEYIELLLFNPTPADSAVLMMDPAAFRNVDVNGDGRPDTLIYRIPIVDDEEPNNPPSGRDTSYVTNEDVPLNARIVFRDPNNDAFKVFVVGQPSYGTVTMTDSATGAFVYTPNANWSGDDQIAFKAVDVWGDTSTIFTNARITVNPVNDKPVAEDDAYTTPEKQTLSVNAARGLRNNDYDVDVGDTLTVAKLTDPAHGSVTVNTDGSFTYVPEADWSGTVTFRYYVADKAGLRDTATATIVVTPINHPPVAVDDSLETNEDVPLTISDAELLANDTDPDGDPLSVNYTGSANHGDWNPSTRVYTPRRDYNGYDTLYYKASDGGSELSNEAKIVIHVKPVNDAPVAANDNYQTEQNTALAVSAANGVLKNDSDVDGDALSASLLHGPKNGTLTGALASNGSFTYTPNTDFFGVDSLVYVVSDGSLRDTAVAYVTVTKTGLILPTLDDAVYSVAENSAGGTPVGVYNRTNHVHWNDPVVDTWTSISLSGTGADQFRIAPDGSIAVANGARLDYETKSVYALTVNIDGVEANVTINVTNVVETPSMPNLGPWSVTENVAGDQAGTATLSSSNDYPPSSFSIVSGTTSFWNRFEIGASSGIVKLKDGQSLDYESVKTLTLTIRATNSDGRADKTVTINVNPVNEPFALADRSYGVAENSAVNTRVDDPAISGAISDPDCAGGQHCGPYTYTLLTTGVPFKINASTGALSVNGTLDYEARSSYTLIVGVGDGTFSEEMAVTVNVTNVSEPPVGIPATFTVLENEEGAFLGQVKISNADAGIPPVTFASVSDPRFQILSSGYLSLNSGVSLDYEAEANHRVQLTVRARNSEGYADVPVTVNIVDVNEKPELADVVWDIAENSPNSTTVGVFTAVDPDAGDALTYTVLGYVGPFSLNQSTGALTVSGAIDYELQNSYSFQVVVRDAAGLKDTANATINVTNVPENPTLPDSTVFYVREHEVAVQIGMLSAGNIGSRSPTWSILSGNGAGLFSLNASTGLFALGAGKELDYESTAASGHRYRLVVRVSVVDGSTRTADQIVVVNVLPVNEPPTIANQTFTTGENTVVGTTWQVVASDPEGNISGFAILDTAGVPFSITATGLLNLERELDFETRSQYVFRVAVTDGEFSDTATVTFDVTDENERPEFTVTWPFDVEENLPAGTFVGALVATDPDGKPGLTWSVVGDSPFEFADPSSGVLTTTAVLNYEDVDGYDVTVRVVDEDGGVAQRRVTINVIDVNDPPVVSHTDASVRENAPGGTRVTVVRATDEDRPANTITFRIVEAGDLFQIADNGVVTVRDSVVLDYETTPTITLVVGVSDGTVEVLDTIPVALADLEELTHLDLVEVTDGDSTWTKPDTIWTNRDTVVATYDYSDSTGTVTYVVTIDGSGDTTLTETWKEPGAETDSSVSFVVRYNDVAPDVAIHVPDLVEEPTENQPLVDSTGMIWTNDPKQPLELVTKYVNARLKKQTDSTLAEGQLTSKQKKQGWTLRYLDADGNERDGLSEGLNVVIASYRDVYGNVGHDTLRVTLDTDAPKVKILNPEDGDTFERLRLDVEWTVNGKLQDWQTTESVALGENWIVRESIDLAGNRGADSVRVVITSQGNEVKISLETPLVDNADQEQVIDYIDDISKAVEEATGSSTFTTEDGETVDLSDAVNLAQTGEYVVTVVNQETGEEELLIIGADGKRIRFADADADPNNGGNGGNGGGNGGSGSPSNRPSIDRKDGHQGVTLVLDLSFPLNNIADEDGDLQGVFPDTLASASADTVLSVLLSYAGSDATVQKLANVKSYTALVALVGEDGVKQLEIAMGLAEGSIAESYESGSPIVFQVSGKGSSQTVEAVQMKAMYVLKVQDIRMDYFDNLGQFVKSATIPGFVFDQSAYQKNDGKVKVFVEMLPNITDGSTCGGMTDEHGREWGTGAFLVKTLVRTRAIPADGCESCIKQTFSEETVKLFGYRRKACDK